MGDASIDLGRVVGVHGLGGEVAVRTTGDAPEGISRYKTLLWVRQRSDDRELELLSSRVHKGMALLTFEGVDDREAAEDLVGGVLRIDRTELQPAEDGRVYVADLIGLAVETTTGRMVGRVKNVLDTGANDVYAVDCNGKEVLIPAVDHIVKKVDVAAGRVIIEEMDGLLE